MNQLPQLLKMDGPIMIPSTKISQPIPSSPPSTTEEKILSKPTNSSNKPLKLNNMSKSKWNPNAPLGSEYEIQLVILNK